MKQPTYQPRARFCGNVEWLCAFCGKLNRNRLAYNSWQFECKSRNCSRRFRMGLTFYVRTREGSGGRNLFPMDYLPLPEDCFPIVPLREWRRGAPAHEVVIEGEDPSINAIRPAT